MKIRDRIFKPFFIIIISFLGFFNDISFFSIFKRFFFFFFLFVSFKRHDSTFLTSFSYFFPFLDSSTCLSLSFLFPSTVEDTLVQVFRNIYIYNIGQFNFPAMPPYFVPNFQISFFIPLFLSLFSIRNITEFRITFHRLSTFQIFFSPLPSPLLSSTHLSVSSTIRTEDVRFIFFFLLKWTRNTLNFAKFSKSILSISIFFFLFFSLCISPHALFFASTPIIRSPSPLPSPVQSRDKLAFPLSSFSFPFPSPRSDLRSYYGVIITCIFVNASSPLPSRQRPSRSENWRKSGVESGVEWSGEWSGVEWGEILRGKNFARRR